MIEGPQDVCLSYRNASKTFGAVKALDDVTLDIHRYEIFGFIGPDGAGKTTMIRMAMGILNPDPGGACRLLGSLDRRKARFSAGYVPQIFSLYSDMSVSENIALFGSLYGTPKHEAMLRAETMLKNTGLWPFRDRLAGKLSGGMKQKLALAIGLLHTPDILFLDEPTTGVDPVARREFWAMLYDLNRNGLSIVVSTPYMDEAELCTRKMFINRGKILDVGTSDELLGRYRNKVLRLDLGERRAKDWLMDCGHVLDANLFGSVYHIVVDDVDMARRSIEDKFRAKGIAMPELIEISPSLEDLFVSYAGGGMSE